MKEYTILDLEWNSSYAPRIGGYLNEIIQFGAVRLDSELRVIGQFDTFVRPQAGTKLTRLVEQLTSITNEDVKNGIRFMDAFQQFCDFARGSVVLTWGDGDLRELISNYRYYTGSVFLPMEAEYANLQDFCQAVLQLPPSRQVGLSDAAAQLGIDPEAFALHRAIDDSLLSAECLRRTYDAGALAGYIVPMDDELYRKMSFKARFITDRDDPLVDQTQLEFSCPDCGTPLKGKEDWGVHNKQFFRRFVCRDCGKKYKARVQFKQRYEGVQVKRNLQEDLPKPPPEEASVHGN